MAGLLAFRNLHQRLGTAAHFVCVGSSPSLYGALIGGLLSQHLSLVAAGRMVGVGEFEQFDGRAVFDDERDAYAIGGAVRSD